MIQAEVCCADRSLDEHRVILGCSDGSIILYDVERKITQMMKTSLVSL
jgi:WD repeat-containing and planar cell polarity effector protein Fritz